PDIYTLSLHDALPISKYFNSALQITKDNGASNSVKHMVVRFRVPKDSLNEYAYMTLPATKPSGGAMPVIILCHGYTVPASYSTRDRKSTRLNSSHLGI